MVHDEEAGGDVGDELEVVARDDDCSTGGAVVVGEEPLQCLLAAWVEEVERFVEDDYSRVVDECRGDSHLLSVACREIADERRGGEKFVAGETVELLDAFAEFSGGNPVDTCDEVEVLFRTEEVDEESLVDERSRPCLPFLRQPRVDAV